MEGEMKSNHWRGFLSSLGVLFMGISFPILISGQERPSKAATQIELKKTPTKTRQYKGKTVEGEERVIKRGDSLWRILVDEKGLSEKRFGRYLIVIQSLNPQLKKPDILQVGDTIFIPIRPDEILGIQVSSRGGETKIYRVRPGDYLYKILREQFGIQEKEEIKGAFDRVKELNPQKKNWNLLFVGEAVLFPIPGKAPAPAAAPSEPAKPLGIIGLDYGRQLPARENLALFEQVMEALGNELRYGGEEVLPLKEGTVHIDRNQYPVVSNPKKEQKVILDLEGKIPASLRSKLEKQGSATPVVSVKKGASLHDAVSSVLSRLGFQSLPPNQPIVIQDGGVGLQVKGEWMVTPPEGSGARQEVLVISLTDPPGMTPDYLRDYLSFRGMSLKEILLPAFPLPRALPPSGTRKQDDQIESWPREKSSLVDAFLRSHNIPFSNDQQLSVALREGIRMEVRVDRLLESSGKKVALFYRAVGDEVRTALQEKHGMRAIELDLSSLSTRELIWRLLDAIGERAIYREHRFPATESGAKDKVVLTVAGFFLPNRSLLITDREIPRELQPFFGEKGLRVIYFR